MRRAVQVGRDIEAHVGAAGRRAVDRALGIDQARTLLEHRERERAVRLHRRLGGRHQPALHAVGRQRRIRLQHQGHDAGGDAGGLRSAGDLQQPALLRHLRAEGRDQRGGRRDRRGHMATRRDHVGLHEAFVRRTCGRERGHAVIGQIGRRVAVRHRTHGDHVGHVARHADGHRLGPRVARRGHHHDAGLPGRHHRLVQRIVPVVRLRRRAERQVQHTDVVLRAVGDHPVDALDHVEVAAEAGRIEGTHHHQARGRRDAMMLGRVLGQHAACGDRRHVRAMAARIASHGGAGGAADEIGARLHARAEVVLGRRRKAGVEHGDRDAGALDPEGVQLVRAHQRRVEGFGLVVGVLDHRIGGDLDLPIRLETQVPGSAQALGLARGQLRADPADQRQFADHLAAHGAHAGRDGLGAAALDDIDLALSGAGDDGADRGVDARRGEIGGTGYSARQRSGRGGEHGEAELRL